jgi:hypothetical protein
MYPSTPSDTSSEKSSGIGNNSLPPSFKTDVTPPENGSVNSPEKINVRRLVFFEICFII